jgi:hypothetical protein
VQGSLVVRSRLEPVGSDPSAKPLVVVDLTVADQPQRPVLGPQRLIAPLQVRDGQPPVAQPGAADLAGALAVGSAVRQPREHPMAEIGVERTVRCDYAGHST